MGELVQFVRGVTFAKSEQQADGAVPVLRGNNITLSSNSLNFDDVIRISDAVKIRPNQHLYRGDIVISTASGSRAHVGKVAYVYEDIDDYVFGGFMGVIRTKEMIEPRFLFHLLTGQMFSTYLEQTLSTSTINNLNASMIHNFMVPVPNLYDQKQVVDYLDSFDTLINDLSIGLPAELAARRQQYEYYRDRLLSFPEAS